MKHPSYKGAGNHSVRELEQLCEDFNEYCYQQQLIKQELLDNLARIVDRIEESQLQEAFPSAYKRALAAIDLAISPNA